ncbi:MULTISPECIES: hypothetical protein [unclassified Streptomyces]|uniref:hypothetical protein n=1 Tax=unclassified Streptomyces TaxID=2593676 RepID=UPI00332BAB54
MKRALTLAGAAVLAMTGVALTAPQAAAAAPPGYGGPVSTCSGAEIVTRKMTDNWEGRPGRPLLRIWYSPANRGTFCAKVTDEMNGKHPMAVSIRRADWKTVWRDGGTFEHYAGGVVVYGAAGKCVDVYGYAKEDALTEYRSHAFVEAEGQNC